MPEGYADKQLERIKTTKDFPIDDGKTDQSFNDASNINNIMSKFERTGELPALAQQPGLYADFSNVTDYHTSLLQLQSASNAFDDLPAHVRKRFENDPQQFLDFMEDPENRDEGIELGLYEAGVKATEKEPEKAPEPTPPEPPAPAS